jgi:hypothetical protein
MQLLLQVGMQLIGTWLDEPFGLIHLVCADGGIRVQAHVDARRDG